MQGLLRRPAPLGAAVALVLVVSCDNPVCGCTPAVDRAVLHGRVADPAGGAVAGATVVAEHRSPGCGEAGGETGRGRTDQDGRYRIDLASAVPPRPGDCLRAFAGPPDAGTLRGSDTIAFAVAFRTRPPLDSVRVDLVLRAP